jgi:hypothetical protein
MSPQPFSEVKALCNTCRAVLHSFGMVLGQSVLGQTAQRLETRAAQGCHLCALFLGSSHGWTVPDMRTRVHKFFQEHEHRGEIVVTYSKENLSSGHHLLDAVVSVGSDLPDPQYKVISTLTVLNPARAYNIRSSNSWLTKSSIGIFAERSFARELNGIRREFGTCAEVD